MLLPCGSGNLLRLQHLWIKSCTLGLADESVCDQLVHATNGAVAVMRDRHSIQRDSSPDISGHVEVFAYVNGRLALVEAAFGYDFERQLGLAQPGRILALA